MDVLRYILIINMNARVKDLLLILEVYLYLKGRIYRCPCSLRRSIIHELFWVMLSRQKSLYLPPLLPQGEVGKTFFA